jgi:hypothetical protein
MFFINLGTQVKEGGMTSTVIPPFYFLEKRAKGRCGEEICHGANGLEAREESEEGQD